MLLSFAAFFQINIFKNIFHNHYQSVKRLDPDQGRHPVSQDMVQTMRELSADN